MKLLTLLLLLSFNCLAITKQQAAELLQIEIEHLNELKVLLEVPDVVIKPAPSGFYHSGSAIKSADARLVTVADVSNVDGVQGTLVKINWDVINPSEGVYDFSKIQTELEAAELYGDKMTLIVNDAKTMPQYALDSCEAFSFDFRGDQQLTCLPWDSNYQKYKKELIDRLGSEFDSSPYLSGVYFTYSAMTNGAEMHWRVNEADFAAAGYTPEKLLESYNTIMDMYAEAFPTTSIIMEVHTVFDSPYLAEGAYEHCYDTMSTRCGVAIWWCASRMTLNQNESEYPVWPVAKNAAELSFAVCQTIGNMTDQSDRFGSLSPEETFKTETEYFIDNGFNAIESWSKDLKNTNFDKAGKF